MRMLTEFKTEVVNEILEMLYVDEKINVFLIHYFENKINNIGNVYIGKTNNIITEILHIKDDGNSNFTSFYYKLPIGLERIARQIKDLNMKKILLSGRKEDVKYIMDYLKININLELSIYYIYNKEYRYDFSELTCTNAKLRQAIMSASDIKIIKRYLIDFFGAETKQEIDKITEKEKISEDIENGIYLLEVNSDIVGMARYFGNSNKYIDITTVFIDKMFRQKGYGKLMMHLMVKQTLQNNKIPIIQTDINNIVAKKIYEEIGFDKYCEYTFQFIS